jgi:outer membrane receptor protein involved in Fe transport
MLSLVALLLPCLAFAQDGKFRGKVTDKETGEALIGATITVEGTTLGAAADLNGEYVVLRVGAGTYTIKASYIGYAPMSISNVKVFAGQTTTLDFPLAPSTVEIGEVNIVAERPLVQRNTPNTVRVTTREDVQTLPIRGTQAILALNAGVVRQDGDLYIRGGRQGDVSYFVDGASVTNRLFSDNRREGVAVIQEAYEELQLQSGGFTADIGGANSGAVMTTVRTGGSKMNIGLDYRTDDFAKPGEQFLGTSSFGYKNLVANVGGPLEALKMRYFVAGQYNYQRSPSMFLEPFNFEGVTTDNFDSEEGRPLPGPIAIKRNFLNRAWDKNYTLQGTVLSTILDPLSLKLSGSYNQRNFIANTGWPNHLPRLFNLSRQPESDTKSYFLNLKGTYPVNPSTFFEAAASVYNRELEQFDPRFGSDWMKYPDSLANAPFGDTGEWTRRYRGPVGYSVGYGFNVVAGAGGFQVPGTPINSYFKNSQRQYQASLDFVSQATKNWELKVGGRYETWLMRQFNIGNIANGLELLNGTDGKTPGTFESEEVRRIQWARQAGVNNYGYDVFGSKADGDVTAKDAPKKPLFASTYIQNKIEYRDLVVNAGLRYEFFDPRARGLNDAQNYATTDFDQNLDIVKEETLTEGESFSYLLPRLNFSFPVSDKTVFYAQYGKYVQMPSLNNMYVGLITISRTLSPRTAGNAFLTPVGFLAKPERLTQYEMGFRQAITDNAALTVTGFYKDTRDQLQVRKYADANGNSLFTAYLNEDFGTVKGLEFTFDLRRTKRLSARLNFTLQDARGTGSNPQSSFGVVESYNLGRFPDFINPLDFNQAQRGTMLLDYRFGKGDGGKILQGLGGFALLTFNSGHPFTRVKSPASLGQSNAYTVGVIALQDARSSFPIESINASGTPAAFNLDLTLNKVFYLSRFNVELYMNALNVLNTKQVVNVYPTTGTAEDDGWLTSALAAQFIKGLPTPELQAQYVNFYKAFNQDNRYSYVLNHPTNADIYGTPRQIRFGVRFEY